LDEIAIMGFMVKPIFEGITRGVKQERRKNDFMDSIP